MTAVEFQDPTGDVIQKIAIVGYSDNGARVLLQIALQPGDGVGVQVVGGLIQQQHFRLGEQ